MKILLIVVKFADLSSAGGVSNNSDEYVVGQIPLDVFNSKEGFKREDYYPRIDSHITSISHFELDSNTIEQCCIQNGSTIQDLTRALEWEKQQNNPDPTQVVHIP